MFFFQSAKIFIFLPSALEIFFLAYWFLFLIKWNRACKIPRTCLVELSNILNFFNRMEIFFPQESNRQCPYQHSLLSMDKYTHQYIIFHLLITSLMPLCLGFLIYRMGILITPSLYILFVITWSRACKTLRTCLVELSNMLNFVFLIELKSSFLPETF